MENWNNIPRISNITGKEGGELYFAALRSIFDITVTGCNYDPVLIQIFGVDLILILALFGVCCCRHKDLTSTLGLS